MAESHRDEIAKLETLYASNPDGRVFTHLAEACRRAGELDRAREILRRGLQRHPDYASAHVVLGRVLADQGLEADAASSFRRVLELDPENLIARRALAESDRAAGRDADALVHYRELLAHDPSDEGVRQAVAELESRTRPAAPPAAAAPPAWSTSQVEETWEPPAHAPLSLEGSSPGGETRPPEHEPLSLDTVAFEPGALDLGSVDFGGEAAPPPVASLSLADFGLGPSTAEPTAPPPAAGREEPVGAPPESGDEHGWGEWPGASSEAVEPEPVEREPAPVSSAAEPLEAEPRPAPEPPPAQAETAAPAEQPPEAEPTVGAAEEQVPAPEPADTASAEEPSDAERPGVTAAGLPVEAGGVPTETLAALYLAQGIPDRAADVYRELLKQRPDDARLEARLRAAEVEAEELRVRRTGVDEERDVWVSGGADTWDADALAGTAHAWGEQEAEAERTGPSVSEYFRRILGWRPSDARTVTGAGGWAEAAAPAEAAEHAEQEEVADTGPFTFDGMSAGVAEPLEGTEPTEAWMPETGASEAIVFEGEPAEDEPLPYLPESDETEPLPLAGPEREEEEEGEEIAESLPYVFETGAAEERSFVPEDRPFVPPVPFAFDAEEEAAPTFEEASSFAFETGFEPLDEAEDEESEPLPFVFEPVESGEEEEEPLPFELDFAGSAADDESFDDSTPGPTAELTHEAPAAGVEDERPGAAPEPEYPWAIEEQTPAEAEPWAEGAAERPGEMLFLQEAEAVPEAKARAEEEIGWDPTIALADVAPARPRPPASRAVAPSRPSPSPPPAPEADEDEDLEMFRSWLQSLKR